MYLLVPAFIGHGGPHRTNRGLWCALLLWAWEQLGSRSNPSGLNAWLAPGSGFDLRFGLGEALDSVPMMGDGAGHGHGRVCGVWMRHPSGISQPFIHHPIKRHTHTHNTQMHAHTPNTTRYVWMYCIPLHKLDASD